MSALQELSTAGVSIWLDDLSRSRLSSGELARAVDEQSIVGVTTNPTIFAGALADSDAYAEQVGRLAASDASLEDAIDALTCADVAAACDVLRPVYDATAGQDGRVSIEVPPGLARDTEGTIAYAKKLWKIIDRPNAMIKIPATQEGLTAITQVVAAGISVNVTLIFALGRYRRVVEAYINGLERAKEAGFDISQIHSVASIFVSRVDTEVDGRLEAIGTPEALELRGRAGLANCRLAHRIAVEQFSSERFHVLAAAGANQQRPLWASTGVKNPAYPDTMYVSELVAAGTVNTMPEKTLLAFADHGEVHGDTVSGGYAQADADLDALAGVGVDYAEVMDKLEAEGLEKFDASWDELVAGVSQQLGR
ncbi:transaldolase [Brevibacterium sp. 50QC2O2]|uniref:transaldolase n=1 Tax=Brevibacterium TaxID=1696 RepID=UPI00211D121D|nr:MULTISPECIES: transaldolase [unclassified Brevibacterium]MCQ9366826.1 transaldolase [Brevibacterium sp. 91QC2O2]MCQ9383976.1 transaldolase [Brevibacterium sp. 68QC2CO]MCQ9389170.1 transaldolase [Brevibacterium sp. 50QC2O2]